MNALLAGLRRFSLGGIILSLLQKNFGFAIIALALYLLFMFFTWLKAKHFTESISEGLGVEIPTNNYLIYLIRGLLIDLVSPIGVIIGLFKNQKNKVLMLILTYVAFIASIIVFVK
ncbi:MAG: hypothetical protein K6E72_04020 [Saccharofermentans sp.]|nr:hypothetical protein [Saccharofermentans sp.]